MAEHSDPELPLKGFEKIKWTIADTLVYKKIREGLGGKIEGTISAGAALHPTIMRFFNGIGIKCLIGYGLTETSPILDHKFAGENTYWISRFTYYRSQYPYCVKMVKYKQ